MDNQREINIELIKGTLDDYIVKDKDKIVVGRFTITELDKENKKCNLKLKFYREDNYDLLVLLEFFDDKEIDFSITTKGCSVKLKGFYSKAVVTTEEGCEFDVLDMIRPLGYMEVKVNGFKYSALSSGFIF